MSQATLTTERILLVPLSEEHLEDEVELDAGQAELGYRLVRRYWRRGLASEGARELIRHGFEDLGLNRIFAETVAVNAASRATMTAVGMKHTRTVHRSWFEPLPGSDLGGVEYAITRQEWLAERPYQVS